MKMFSMTQEELEEDADLLKVVILKALVRDGLIDEEIAENWAAKTTTLHRKKSFFRTLSDRWNKEKTEPANYYWLVVSG